MEMHELIDKVNNNILPRIGVYNSVKTPDEIFEIIEVLITNVHIHQSVADARARYILQMSSDISRVFDHLIKNASDEIIAKQFTEVRDKMKSSALEMSGEWAYDVAINSSQYKHDMKYSKFGNTKAPENG